jgi:hypothetical protein
MDVILGYIGMLTRMHTLKYSVKNAIYVQTYLTIIINLLFQQQHQQQLVILNRHIIAKKPWNRQPKPKMSNSFEYLQGSIAEIQKKYEILSDMVTEYGGKVHGSQRDRDPKTGLIDLLVYYEVPLGQREEVKQKFNDIIRNIELKIK